jgi:hypothetical protein
MGHNSAVCLIFKFLGLTFKLSATNKETRRALLQYQNFHFLSYLGWSGSVPQSNNYIMKVVQYPSTEINVAGFGVRTTVLLHENLEH